MNPDDFHSATIFSDSIFDLLSRLRHVVCSLNQNYFLPFFFRMLYLLSQFLGFYSLMYSKVFISIKHLAIVLQIIFATF